MAQEPLTHAECGQCGWLGKVEELKEHPLRPVPEDEGFCPDCGSEITFQDILTTAEAEAILASYD